METYSNPISYAVIHKSDEVRAKSRSGGIFSAVSDWILDQGGVIYGCAMLNAYEAKHIRAVSREERDLMRGSKYVQSSIGDTFKSVKADLDSERIVLFTGTSCQVAGLKKFLKGDYANLYCMDIVCHGVPSQELLKQYIAWNEKKYKSRVKSIDFRNKTDFGWRAHIETIYFENGKKVNSTIYRNLFYGHNSLRPSCYSCRFKSITHPGEITIADCWGIEKAAPDLDDDKGVSLVLINNDKGKKLYEKVGKDIQSRTVDISDVMQPPLKESFERPQERDKFWEDFLTKPFDYLAKTYGGNDIKTKIKRFRYMLKKKLMH